MHTCMCGHQPRVVLPQQPANHIGADQTVQSAVWVEAAASIAFDTAAVPGLSSWCTLSRAGGALQSGAPPAAVGPGWL